MTPPGEHNLSYNIIGHMCSSLFWGERSGYIIPDFFQGKGPAFKGDAMHRHVGLLGEVPDLSPDQ